MRISRSLLLLFLASGFLFVALAEEEAPLPTTTAAAAESAGGPDGGEEDGVATKPAGVDAAVATAAAAAAQEVEGAVEDRVGQTEEDEAAQEVSGEDGTTDDGEVEAAPAEGAHEPPAQGVPDADAVASAEDEEKYVDQAADIELEGDEAGPAAAAAVAAAAAAGAEGGSDSGIARRAARRLDGFLDGWRGKVDVSPLKEALGSYDALLEEHYLQMSFAQATTLGVMGDAIAQRLERRWNPGQRYELKRTVHAGILNMIIDGIFTPQWYNLVDYVNNEMTLAMAFVKAIAASVFYGPFANGLFLAGARTLRYGLRSRFDWAEWRRQLTVCTVRDFEMWPPLHILNFWLVPKHWRPLAGHLAGVVLLAVISSTSLTDAGLPLGQRTVSLVMSWARAAGGRLSGRGRRAAGAPPAGKGQA